MIAPSLDRPLREFIAAVIDEANLQPTDRPPLPLEAADVRSIADRLTHILKDARLADRSGIHPAVMKNLNRLDRALSTALTSVQDLLHDAPLLDEMLFFTSWDMNVHRYPSNYNDAPSLFPTAEAYQKAKAEADDDYSEQTYFHRRDEIYQSISYLQEIIAHYMEVRETYIERERLNHFLFMMNVPVAHELEDHSKFTQAQHATRLALMEYMPRETQKNKRGNPDIPAKFILSAICHIADIYEIIFKRLFTITTRVDAEPAAPNPRYTMAKQKPRRPRRGDRPATFDGPALRFACALIRRLNISHHFETSTLENGIGDLWKRHLKSRNASKKQ